MEPTKLKLMASVVIAILIIAALPFIGTTSMAQEDNEGLVIDFGYWDITWTEIEFRDGMNAITLLEEACAIHNYECIIRDGTVVSINGQESLVDRPWTLYTIQYGKWVEYEESPYEMNVSDYSILSWARAGSADELVDGVDATGFEYYGYGSNGRNSEGEMLRIVSLSPTITEMIAAVGGSELIVGTDYYSNYPETITEKQQSGEVAVIGGFTDPNYEKIVELGPDLVFCDESVGSHTHMADKLRKSGINCVVLYDTTGMNKVYDNLWITASALGYSEGGREAIESIESTLNTLTGIIGNRADVNTFISLSTNNMPYTSGGSTYISDVISTVKGKNVFEELEQTWVQINIEALGNAEPEVILLLSDTYVGTQEEYDNIINGLNSIWKSTPAYMNGEIYIFSGSASDLLSRSGPRLAEAAELIGKILHPDQFLNKDSSDIIPKFFGNDYQQYLKYQEEVFF